ncbi:membrane fusion protein (multidrug efflux system) [Oxalobacteraceae bacterium GrIS 1.11]
MKLETLPPSSAPPAARRKRWRAPLIGLIALGLAGASWSVMQARKAPPASEDKGPPKVEVYELARGDVATIEARALAVDLPLSGSLTPLAQATIKAKASGTVLEAGLQEGMAVTAGQVLARLAPGDLTARLTQQQAALDEAQAKLAIALKNEANNLALLKQKYISQTSYDTTQNSVELARASVKSAGAMVEIARIALDDTVIRAPLAGIVSKRYVQVGEKLAPDMPVYSIVNLSQLTLEAQVPASEIARVKVGQEVRFMVDGFGQREFTGKVARINPGAEAGSRALLAYIAVGNGDGALRGGMFAKGNITTERSQVAPLLPLAALRAQQGASVVYAIENGKVVERTVKLGLRNEEQGYAEVSAGLAAGASVIVTRLDGVKPGHAVKLAASPVPAATPARKG